MDEDLRALERQLARDPGDAEARLRLQAIQARAGVPSLAEVLARAEGLARGYHEARQAHAVRMVAALKGLVACAFREHPSLDVLLFTSCLDMETDGEWVVRCQAAVDPRLMHISREWAEARGKRPEAMNALPQAEQTWLQSALLAFAPVLAEGWQFETRIVILRDAILFDPQDGPLARWTDDPRAGDLGHYRADPELYRIALDELHLRELLVGELDALQPEHRTRTRWIEAQAEADALDVPDTRAALAAGRASQAALREAQAVFTREAAQAWEAFLVAVFREDPQLDLILIRGYTDRYNDNWYCEYGQEVIVATGHLTWALERLRARGLDTLGLEEPTRVALRHPVYERFFLQLVPFEQLLRERHGFRWALTLRRTAEGGVAVRVGEAWDDAW